MNIFRRNKEFFRISLRHKNIGRTDNTTRALTATVLITLEETVHTTGLKDGSLLPRVLLTDTMVLEIGNMHSYQKIRYRQQQEAQGQRQVNTHTGYQRGTVCQGIYQPYVGRRSDNQSMPTGNRNTQNWSHANQAYTNHQTGVHENELRPSQNQTQCFETTAQHSNARHGNNEECAEN